VPDRDGHGVGDEYPAVQRDGDVYSDRDQRAADRHGDGYSGTDFVADGDVTAGTTAVHRRHRLPDSTSTDGRRAAR
jgi:hypothetical protein